MHTYARTHFCFVAGEESLLSPHPITKSMTLRARDHTTQSRQVHTHLTHTPCADVLSGLKAPWKQELVLLSVPWMEHRARHMVGDQ